MSETSRVRSYIISNLGRRVKKKEGKFTIQVGVLKVESWMVTEHRDLGIVAGVVGTVGTGEVDTLSIRCRFLLNLRSPLLCVFLREKYRSREGEFVIEWVD